MESSRSPFPPKKLRTSDLIHYSLNVGELVNRRRLARFEGRGVPDLDTLEHTRHNDFVAHARVFAQEAGDKDSTLAVHRAGHGSGSVESAQALGVGIEARHLEQLLFDRGPFIGREQGEVISLIHQHRWTLSAANEFASEDSRNAEPALGVDGVFMSPTKHRFINALLIKPAIMLVNAFDSECAERAGLPRFSDPRWGQGSDQCSDPPSSLPGRPT